MTFRVQELLLELCQNKIDIINWVYSVHHGHPYSSFKFPFYNVLKVVKSNYGRYHKKFMAFQLKPSMYFSLPFIKVCCVKLTSKTFETTHFWLYSLASATSFHYAFSRPKTDRKIGNFVNIDNT